MVAGRTRLNFRIGGKGRPVSADERFDRVRHGCLPLYAGIFGVSAVVRSENHVGKCAQRARQRNRLLNGNVERGSGDAPLPQRGDQSYFVDHGPTARIHDYRGWLHRSQFSGSDQVPRLHGKRDVQADQVGFAKQSLQRNEFDGRLDGSIQIGVGCEDAHFETTQLARYRASDPAQPDNA